MPREPAVHEESEGRLDLPRLSYIVSAAAVVALGLASRRFGAYLPSMVAAYAGDTLWALTAFLGISAILPSTSVSRRAAIALATAYVVELSQLYHAPWIDGLRRTTPGGLLLGFGFLWSDLVCYSVGVASGVVLERLGVRSRARIAREVN